MERKKKKEKKSLYYFIIVPVVEIIYLQLECFNSWYYDLAHTSLHITYNYFQAAHHAEDLRIDFHWCSTCSSKSNACNLEQEFVQFYWNPQHFLSLSLTVNNSFIWNYNAKSSCCSAYFSFGVCDEVTCFLLIIFPCRPCLCSKSALVTGAPLECTADVLGGNTERQMF